MGQVFSDASRSELTAGISGGDTTIAVADGTRFPDANAGTSPVSDANNWFKAVIQDETGFEIVYVRTHNYSTSPNSLSDVLRGQEGTMARSFAATSVIGVRLTAFDMANLWATMANKATDSVALTGAAGTATLPATAAAPVASRLQVLRNNVKQAFVDIGNKLGTDFTSLTTRTIDGNEILAFSGGLKATVQAVLNWVLGRANTWTGTQTFNNAVFTPTVVLTTTTATTYTSGTWYAMPGTAPSITSLGHATYIAELFVQYSLEPHHQYAGSCVISTVGWKAGGTVLETSFALEQHNGNSITASIRPTVSVDARGFEFRFGAGVTVSSGGFVRLTLLRPI